MLRSLIPSIYIRISPEQIILRNVKTGEQIAEPPELAIGVGRKSKILAVGAKARNAAALAGGKVVNPFSHPRSLVSDFTVAEQLIKELLRRLSHRSLLSFAPAVVMHPLGDPAGGFTQVEARAFHEMALGAGASRVMVWSGRELTDREVLSREFPTAGALLS